VVQEIVNRLVGHRKETNTSAIADTSESTQSRTSSDPQVEGGQDIKKFAAFGLYLFALAVWALSYPCIMLLLVAQLGIWAWSWGMIMSPDARYDLDGTQECKWEWTDFKERYNAKLVRRESYICTRTPMSARPFGHNNFIHMPFQLMLTVIGFIPSMTGAVVEIVFHLGPSAVLYWLIATLLHKASVRAARPADFLGLSELNLKITVQLLFGFILVYVETCFIPIFPIMWYMMDHTGWLIVQIWDNPKFWFRFSDGLLLLLLMAICSFVVFRIVVSGKLAFIAPALRRREAENSEWAMLFLVFLSLISALAYYSRVYDENGTFKPAWAENLG
jgi:hypothetical protein